MAKEANFLYKAVGILGLLKTIWVLQAILLDNDPNPFNPETWLPFQLSQDAEVRLTIYGVAGKSVRKMQVVQALRVHCT